MLLALVESSPTADLPPWLLLVAAALAAVLIWRTLAPPNWRNWRSGGGSASGAAQRSDPLSNPQPPSLSQQRSVERDVQALMHELLEMSRKVVQQIDARTAKLQELMKQADERIERLAEMERRAAAASMTSRDGASPTPAAPVAPSAPAPRHAAEPEISIEIDPRHEQVYLLEDEGLNAMQISNRLNIPEGEVELILALRPRRRVAS